MVGEEVEVLQVAVDVPKDVGGRLQGEAARLGLEVRLGLSAELQEVLGEARRVEVLDLVERAAEHLDHLEGQLVARLRGKGREDMRGGHRGVSPHARAGEDAVALDFVRLGHHLAVPGRLEGVLDAQARQRPAERLHLGLHGRDDRVLVPARLRQLRQHQLHLMRAVGWGNGWMLWWWMDAGRLDGSGGIGRSIRLRPTHVSHAGPIDGSHRSVALAHLPYYLLPLRRPLGAAQCLLGPRGVEEGHGWCYWDDDRPSQPGPFSAGTGARVPVGVCAVRVRMCVGVSKREWVERWAHSERAGGSLVE